MKASTTWSRTLTATALLLAILPLPAQAAPVAPAPLHAVAEKPESDLVPLRAACEAAGATVAGVQITWDKATNSVAVNPLGTRALTFVRALGEGTVGEMRAKLTPAMASALPEERIKAIQTEVAQAGALTGMQVTGEDRNQVHTNVHITATYERSKISYTVRFDRRGLIDDYFVSPAPAMRTVGAPAYTNPKAFTDREVVIGAETAFPLPARLSLPKGKGPFPAVVLVHGSGPFDRDETYMALKPFRDLAKGLASRGIAVLRYEKRTHEHSIKAMANLNTFTPQDETITDAVEAVKFLSHTAKIDPKKVFVVGHSQGGLFLPQILGQAGELAAGGVSLAGPNDFVDALVKQMRFLGESGGMPAAQAAFLEQQFGMLRDPEFSPTQAPAGFVLGAPAFWYEFRAHPAQVAKGQKTPLLLLQGGRDYQVPAEQLESWKQELAGREKVTYKLFPKLNHFFTEGDGAMKGPEEYQVPANIPLYVIEEISTWVKAQ